MKIRNIAFFGIMASILTVAGANAAIATNTTKIASKQYVDAQDTATLTAAAIDATTKANAAQAAAEATAAADATTKANAAQAAAEATAATYTDTKVATLDGQITSTAGQPFTSITETDGVVTATTGTITTAAFDSNTLKTVVSATSSDTELPTAKAVYDAVSAANSAIEGLDLNDVASTGMAVTSVSQLDGQVTAGTGTIDVEHGIDPSAKATSTTVDISATTGGSDNKMVTEGGLKKVVTDLDATGVDGSADGKPVVAVSQADGIVAAQLGEVGTEGIRDNAVTSAKIQDATILNEDIAANAAINYSKMENSLKDINTDGTATCSADNPCVVTYLGNGNYNYTQFEYANPAVPNAASGS